MASSIEKGAAEIAQLIADALSSNKIPYAIGGALALAVAGVPRGTADVDINVFVDATHAQKVISVLTSIGTVIEEKAALRQAKDDGMLMGRFNGMRIDVFFPSIDFAIEAGETRIQVSDESGWTGWFLSAEALSVFKLLFFRGKDVVDLQRLVAVRPELDKAYIRRWMVEMMGEEDERIVAWDNLVERFGE